MNTDQVDRTDGPTDEPDWERDLAASLRRHVDTVSPPVLDTDALLRRARRRRDYGVGGVVLAAAAVVAMVIVLGSLVGGRSNGTGEIVEPAGAGLPAVRGNATGPTPVEGPRQLFTATTKVFMNGRTLDVRVPDSTGAHVSRFGLAYPRPGDHHPMLLGAGGRSIPLGKPLPAGATYDDWVAADSDGPLVAWAQTKGRMTTVVAWDTGVQREIARLERPCRTSYGELVCPRPYVADSEVVIVDGGDGKGGVTAWTPETGRNVSLGKAFPNQAHNRVFTTFEDMGTAPQGALPGWQQAHSPKGFEALLSFDGAWLLDANGDPKVIDWRNPGRSITYHPPGKVTEAQFDTDGSVLLVVDAGQGRSTGWDCRLGAECQRVVPPTTDLHLVAWDT